MPSLFFFQKTQRMFTALTSNMLPQKVMQKLSLTLCLVYVRKYFESKSFSFHVSMYRLQFSLVKNTFISQKQYYRSHTNTAYQKKERRSSPTCLQARPSRRSKSLATGIKFEISTTVHVCNMLDVNSKRQTCI